jgi:hypothetical protein
MTEKGAEGRQSRPEEVAAYIAVLTAEMVRLARDHKLPELAYLLDLARLEAVERSPQRQESGQKRIA